MRIQGPRNPFVAKTGSKEQEAKTEGKAEEARGSERADVVSIGSTARSLATTGSKLGPEIRARLEEVREQLKNNEYAVDYRKLASNILGDEAARAGGEGE